MKINGVKQCAFLHHLANVPAILTWVRSNAYLFVCLNGVNTYVPGCLTASYT